MLGRFLRKLSFLHYGFIVTLVLTGVLVYNLVLGDRGLFLPGATTHGHHQIEMACSVCHVEAFVGDQAMQNACVDCHAEELDKARDTHPKKKFIDPRNSDLLSNLDATQCVTCHVEHSPEVTGAYGLTLPEDFCFYCHREIAEERPSHGDFEFTSCSDSGCHNYHDNKALYEKYLSKHSEQPVLLKQPTTSLPNSMTRWFEENPLLTPLNMQQNDWDQIATVWPKSKQDTEALTSIIKDWSQGSHATAQINCSDCHNQEGGRALDPELSALNSCTNCHERQSQGFRAGLHGMRHAAGLSPMQVRHAELPMHPEAANRTLTCASCHDPHKPNRVEAAVQACLACHNDEHSNNYEQSKHYQAWLAEQSAAAEPGSGVSCATCHMPASKKGKRVYVEHNQNLTLQPNSKMLRPVCQHCHGLEFSIAALTDRNLIRRNFSGAFDPKHPSFALVNARQLAKRARKTKPARKDKSSK